MSAPTYSHLSIRMPTTGAGTGDVIYACWPYPVGGRVSSLRFTPEVDVTAHDVNYTDLSVELDGTEIASEETTTADTGNLVAGTDIEFALTDSGKGLEVVQNSVFSVKKTDAGTGVIAGGTVDILIVADRKGA